MLRRLDCPAYQQSENVGRPECVVGAHDLSTGLFYGRFDRIETIDGIADLLGPRFGGIRELIEIWLHNGHLSQFRYDVLGRIPADQRTPVRLIEYLCTDEENVQL